MNYLNVLVTIVVPVYNSESFLEECVESILNQTYENFELIIINDGSTDSSLSICKKYEQQDKRITLFNVPNGGVSKARNLGIRNAKGEWICFIDSDDWVSENFIYNFFLESPSEDCLVVQEINKFHKGNAISKKSYTYERFAISNFNDLLLNNSVLANGYTVAKLYNKSIINKYEIHFNENLIFAEDLVFYLTYLKNIKYIHFLKVANYFYRIHNESASFKTFKFEDIVLSFLQVKDRLSKLISKEYWLSNNEIEKSISMFFVLSLYSIYDVKKMKIEKNKRIEFLSFINDKDDLLLLRNTVNKYDLGRKYIIRLFNQNKLNRLDNFLLYYVKFDQIFLSKLKKFFLKP
ncbi:glycosyltransferase family 2 protein [Flavobacterium sp. xlx-214]|uniref:glycosyltransferase family 2 protein n=1 Tax=unclassified Flavobacterium TaxID=196869 RepID=UPI0013D0BCE3|nr:MULTISPECIES: glycosyltransferase family 2 protein [unclassified Flavobacterium]MBA5794006.1 glycosyltransferase family 2 protein [Flavobacterium sp. xlx-221]QMI83177.1 glycosyltransferase family 2 protein [Flavobacterium sp. xlx-214]